MKCLLFIGRFVSEGEPSCPYSQSLANELQKAGWKIIRTSYSKNPFAMILDISRVIFTRREDYSAAHIDVFSGRAFIWAEVSVLLLRFLGKKIYLSLHGGGLPDFAEKVPRRVAMILNAAAVVTTPSQYIQKNLSFLRKDIRYLPNAVPIQKYPFRKRDLPKPRIVWLRAFHKIYNPALAVKVILNIKQKIPDVEMCMIGPDKKDGTLQSVQLLITQSGLNNNIRIEPGVPHDQVSERFRQADIFINTTNFESFGVSMMEAAACGLCLVSTDAGEIPYLWKSDLEAMLVTRNDSGAMSDAVIRVLREPGLAEKLSVNARRRAEFFDWEKVLPLWLDLFQEAVLEKEEK